MASTCVCATNFILFFFFIASLCSGGCIESEKNALLQFKDGLSDPSNRLSDWVSDGSDCCSWIGVVCSNVTFHVLELYLRTLSFEEYYGPDPDYLKHKEYEEYRRKLTLGGKVSSSLLQLKHLSYLDLSYNDFGGISIPKFFGYLHNLRYLNLSDAGFGGMVPSQLGNLSNLQYLNLGEMYDLYVENLDWVSSLSSLEFLDMSYVNLSQSFDWLKVIKSVSSLLELHLSSCSLSVFNPTHLPSLNLSSLLVLDLSTNSFRGPIPNEFQNMTSSFLRELDLSWNYFNSSIPDWLYDLTQLQILNLRRNQLQGQISSGIGNLTSLITIDLSYNRELEFEKEIPNSFKHFCNLKSLHLSTIKLNQEVNDILEILLSGCVSDGLPSLTLDSCELSGQLTHDLNYFRNLITFYISYNSISGPIPLSLGEMNSLKRVDLSNNKLEGEVSHLHFAKLTRLVDFDASGNNIALRVSSNWIPPLQLQILGLGSWQVGSQFPKWLRLLKHLIYLDLSNSGISTPIPFWFWDSFQNYIYLTFSRNQMHGSIPNIPFASGVFPVIDLSSNNFSGPIPYFSPNVIALDLSNNSFSGSIFKFLCNKINQEKQMRFLNLERNFLHGEIPDCWSSWKNLAALKLSNNKFSGNIPNSIGILSFLESPHLHNNNLSGEIPSTIQNCKNLCMLDFSENNLVGSIPTWIGDGFANWSILILHENKFDGYIPKELCHLVSLHILDLAHNGLSGTIPSCFSNFTKMAIRNDDTGVFIKKYCDCDDFLLANKNIKKSLSFWWFNYKISSISYYFSLCSVPRKISLI
ncbi:receptor-like protein EIX2 [Euphorbia lathyris]|uniref:receptor-like protein EIX2 n=1 Tax=Euphorbia lathyris TaxID=212925 RepID=UPI0033131047